MQSIFESHAGFVQNGTVRYLSNKRRNLCLHDKFCIDILDLGVLIGASDTIVVLDAIEDTEVLLVGPVVENPEVIVVFSGLITWVLHTKAKKMRTPCSRLMTSKARRALKEVWLACSK